MPTPANMPPWLLAMIYGLGRGGPLAAGAYGMGKIIDPQPLNQGETVPFNARPQHPSSNVSGIYNPLSGGSANPGNFGIYNPLSGGSANPGNFAPPPPAEVASPAAQGIGQGPFARRPTSPVASAPPAARPSIDPSTVNLGYYRAGVGNARTPTPMLQGQTNAPPIYRGPMTTGPRNLTPYYG